MLEMNENKEFITFNKSERNHYYGLAKSELQRALDENKIPILKFTLDAYLREVSHKFDCNAVYIYVSNLSEL